MTDICSGTMFANIIARPEILPTDTWLGIRKKNTDAETISVANVITAHSLMISDFFIF